MADKRVKIWFDAEGDYLEAIFNQKPGYFRETASDQVMEKVDQDDNVLGFSVLRMSASSKRPSKSLFEVGTMCPPITNA